MQDLDPKQIGLRIKSARVLTGLNQEEFAKECGFNHTSLRNWEFGRVLLREGAVLNLIEALQKFAIQVTFDWLLYGAGVGPVLCSEANTIPAQKSNFSQIVSDFQKLSAINNERALTTIVADSDMEPLYHCGDLLLALIQPLDAIQNLVKSGVGLSPYLVKMGSDIIQPRYLVSDGAKFWLRSHKNDLIEPLETSWVGKIVIRISKDIIDAKDLAAL
jgi:transcriptional regulator with XRE-family HTH domain